MKTTFLAVIMLTLILTSALNLSIINSTFAKNNNNAILNDNFSKNSNQTQLANEVTNSQNTLENKVNPNQEEPSKTSNKSSYIVDKWDFNNTNEWYNFTYRDHNKTRLIVGVKDDNSAELTELESIAARHQAKIVNKVSIGGAVRAVVIELPFVSVLSFVSEVQVSGLASYIEPNMKVKVRFEPNDPYWNLQWGPHKIEANWAWNFTTGNSSVLVAVVDTGIDYNHPDLADNYVPVGYDWVNNDSDPLDDFGHGTHCAGIIAAVLNNSLGVSGLAQVHIMAEKSFDNWGTGYDDWIANGIIHAVDEGANIISMSFGQYADSELLHDAIKYAYDAGVLLISSAGNDNTNTQSYPACYDEVIAVTATDQYDTKAYFSNWGNWVELAAPGVDIYSTMPTYYVTLNDWGYPMNYSYMSGTSMACPHVAGVAALIWSLYPDKTRDWIRLWLRYTADDLGDPSFDVYYGFGRINARNAVEVAPPIHELIAYDLKTPPYVEPTTMGIINATILNFGENDEINVTIQLLANNTMVDSRLVYLLPSGNATTVTLMWNPTVEGLYNVTLYVEPVPGETNVENNALSKPVYVGIPIKAVVLHSAGNVFSEIITNWQVLTNQWYLFGDTMLYVDYTTLNKESITYEDIAATGADVLIISCAYDSSAGWEFTDSEIEAIKQYVHEGHGLIATAGTFYYGVPNNNKLAPLFGLNETIIWSATTTDLLELINTTHPLFTDVPNPLVFPQVGTSLPYDLQWSANELKGGHYLALGHYQESAIVAFRGLVYISPWLEVIPAYYHHHLQLLYNAIRWSRYQKPEHDLTVSLDCPFHLNPGENTLLNATVKNAGLNNETNVELILLVNGEQVDNLTIPTLTVDQSETLSYLWTPPEGIYNITAYAPSILGEEDTFNNAQTMVCRVSYAVVIGFIETHGETLHSDDLKLYYQSLNHIVNTICSPLTTELLADYDILIVGEDWSNTPWSTSEITAVQNFIESGKGFVAIGDELAFSVQEILNAYGMAYTGYGGYSGSSSYLNYSHPIMQGVNSIYIPNPINSLYVTPPGDWIANDASNMYTIIAGSQHVLCVSDDLAAYVYSDDNGKMFTNIISWLAPPEHDLAVNLEAPKFLEPSGTTLLNITVKNRGTSNETNVNLQLIINGTEVNSTIIPELPSGSIYKLSYIWTPTLEGIYNITVYAPPVLNESITANNVKSVMVLVQVFPEILIVDDNDGGAWINGTSLLEFESALATTGYHYWIWNETSMGNPPLDFLTQFQLVIWTCGDYWSNAVDSTDAVTLESYLAQGGNILLEGEDIGYDHHADDFMLNVAHAIYEVDDTGAPGLTVTNPNHPVTLNLPSSVAWLTDPPYDDGVSPANGGAEVIQYTGTSWTAVTIFEGAGSRSVIYYAFPLYALPESYRNTLTINSVNWLLGMGFQHELVVKLEAPEFLEPGSLSILNATVYNKGLNNETNVELLLLVNNSLVDSLTIPELLTKSSDTLNYLWSPTVEGIYNITAYVPPVPNENFTANNVVTQMITVRFVKGYILFDQTHSCDSAGDYSIWIANLTDRGYVITTLAVSPISPASLEGYDVFIIPQAHTDYSSDELLAIHDFVINGGGLIVIGDDYPYIYTELTEFANITWDWENYGWSGYTSNITPHPVTQGVNTAYFASPLSQLYVNSPASDLIRDGSGYGEVMLSVSEVGAGKVIGIADEHSINDYCIGYADNLQLASNIVDWMIIGYHDVAIVDVTPSANEVVEGESVEVGVTVENQGNFTETFNVTLYASCQGNSTLIPYELISSSALPTIYVDPQEILGQPPSSTFIVGVKISNVTNLYGFEMRFRWDPSLLEYVNHTVRVPRDLYSDGVLWGPVFQAKDEVDPLAGTYWIAYASLNPAPPFNGSGTFFYMTFHVKDFGSCYLNFDFTKLANISAEPIMHNVQTGYFSNELAPSPPIVIGTITVSNLSSGGIVTLTFSWNTTGVFGNYSIYAEASVVPFEANKENNVFYDGIISITPAIIRDVAILNVTAYPSAVYAGRIVNITVLTANNGNMTETFNVKIYANTTVIGVQTVNLDPWSNITLTFYWNTSGLTPGDNFIIWAEASNVPGEFNTENNIFTDGYVKIKMLGDINGDGTINVFDIVIWTTAFDSKPGSPNWNSDADMNNDGVIDIFDGVVIGVNFGKTY